MTNLYQRGSLSELVIGGLVIGHYSHSAQLFRNLSRYRHLRASCSNPPIRIMREVSPVLCY